VGKDAARYFFVNRSSDSHLDFDLDLAREQSSENPVYYVQYAHARICSILRQAGEIPNSKEIDLSLLNDPTEHALLEQIAELPKEVEYAALHLEPHRLTHYVFNLANLFHGFIQTAVCSMQNLVCVRRGWPWSMPAALPCAIL